MPINAHPEYFEAEKRYLASHDIDEKIEFLEEMIRLAPKHKSSEKFVAELKTRLRKLREKAEVRKKTGKTTSIGIKKQDMQAVIIGRTNTGKSSLLSVLTNTFQKTAEYDFTTKTPQLAMMNFGDTQVQVIENPAIESDYYDKGLTNTTDIVLILINSIKEIGEIMPLLNKTAGKSIIIFNKIDLLEEHEKRKIFAYLSSKKYNFVMISTRTQEGINELKERIFQSFGRIRVYTKEPGKEPSKRPYILEPGSNIKRVAEKILKGFSEKIKETRLWGPSSKFPGQIVGLKHVLKDKDIVEFKTK